MSPPCYFSILLLAGCWLPRWELLVGLKPRSARDVANPPVPETTFWERFLLIVICVFISLSLPCREGKAASKLVGMEMSTAWGEAGI